MPSLNRTLKSALLPGLLIFVTACSSQQNVNFSVIQKSNQCRKSAAQITQLSSKEDQQKVVNQLNRFADANSLNRLTKLFEQHANKEHLFLVAQGQKPSAGYGFEIKSETGSLVKQTLTLPISFTKPASGSMQAQVMTSPCIILGIDTHSHYDRLVIDELELKL